MMPLHYLDYAASAPLLPQAREAWIRASERAGNPSSMHGAGQGALAVFEESRERIAACLGADPHEVLLTSGGTEADSLAILGSLRHWDQNRGTRSGRNGAAGDGVARIVVGAAEHHAILETARIAEADGSARVFEAPVDGAGLVVFTELEEYLTRYGAQVALVSIQWANNEVGTIQPIEALARLCRRFAVPIHSDAVQAAGKISIDFDCSGLDALSVSAHKVGGPVGVGALLARRQAPLLPISGGGGQARGIRSGTLDSAGAAAFAAALEHAVEQMDVESRRLSALADGLISAIGEIPGAFVTGPTQSERRIPGLVNAVFPGCDGELLLYLLDREGIQVSTGAACTAGVAQPSHVLLAMGREQDEASAALRMSLGHGSTPDDVEAFAGCIGHAVATARAAR